ncbi:MAG: sporulation integral membrane protein YtvI [Oscillospiraceae bacterium]|nr:sporulation integral membrane protein YtvI [Oscillospiraceae bacterium]
MTKRQKSDFLLNFAAAAAVFILIWMVLKVVLPCLLPFVIGFAIAFFLKPAAVWLTRATSIKRKGVSFIVILMFYLLVGNIVWLAGAYLLKEIGLFLHGLPQFYDKYVMTVSSKLNLWLTAKLESVSPQAAFSASELLRWLSGQTSDILSDLSANAILKITEFARKLPMIMVTFLFSVICSVFISMDYNNIVSYILELMPFEWRKTVFKAKDFLLKTFGRLIKAYGIILSLTLAQLWLGLSLLGAEHAFLMALIISLLDILPIVGAGGVLVPWGLYEVVLGSTAQGIGLLILYVLVVVVRNMAEPKIVGKQMGLHPVLTITAMYAGMKLFGLIGVIAAPPTALMIKYLLDDTVQKRQ